MHIHTENRTSSVTWHGVEKIQNSHEKELFQLFHFLQLLKTNFNSSIG